MPNTCVRCGNQIKKTVVKHMRRKDGIEYHFHAYDCAIEGCARLPADDKLFYKGTVICACGEPLISTRLGLNFENPTNTIPTLCPSCKRTYHITAVIDSLVESQVTVATPDTDDNNITPIRSVLK